jgi:hypothetical protein
MADCCRFASLENRSNDLAAPPGRGHSSQIGHAWVEGIFLSMLVLGLQEISRRDRPVRPPPAADPSRGIAFGQLGGIAFWVLRDQGSFAHQRSSEDLLRDTDRARSSHKKIVCLMGSPGGPPLPTSAPVSHERRPKTYRIRRDQANRASRAI